MSSTTETANTCVIAPHMRDLPLTKQANASNQTNRISLYPLCQSYCSQTKPIVRGFSYPEFLPLAKQAREIQQESSDIWARRADNNFYVLRAEKRKYEGQSIWEFPKRPPHWMWVPFLQPFTAWRLPPNSRPEGQYWAVEKLLDFIFAGWGLERIVIMRCLPSVSIDIIWA